MTETHAPVHAQPLSNQVIGGNSARRILVVDDEETIRLALARFLRTRGYTVETADDGPSALDALRRARFDLMLSDVRMPGITGVDLVPLAIGIDPEIAIVVLTAVNDAPTATEVLSRGAMDYLMKPIELDDLQQAVERTLHRRDLLIEQRNVERLIREEVALRTADLEREMHLLRATNVAVVQNIVHAFEEASPWFRRRTERVTALATRIAQALGHDADLVESINTAGRLHDVGMVMVPSAIVDKAGPLTDEEYAQVQAHVRAGVELLRPIRHIAQAVAFVHDHHERWDGSGYPRGLVGDNISIGGRILGAADAYVALTSPRAWRPALDPDEALRQLAGRAGSILDPAVYEVLCRVVRAGE